MSNFSKLVELAAGNAVVSAGGKNVTLPHKHTDERRTIYEVWVEEIGLLQVLHILSNTGPLGQHYHHYTSENFAIARGFGEVLLVGVDSEGDPIGLVERRQLSVGSVLEVEPYRAHTFYLKPESVMTCVASHLYDPEDAIPTPWLVRPD